MAPVTSRLPLSAALPAMVFSRALTGDNPFKASRLTALCALAPIVGSAVATRTAIAPTNFGICIFGSRFSPALRLRGYAVTAPLHSTANAASSPRRSRSRNKIGALSPQRRSPRPPPFAVDLLEETLFRLKWAVKGLDRRRRRGHRASRDARLSTGYGARSRQPLSIGIFASKRQTANGGGLAGSRPRPAPGTTVMVQSTVKRAGAVTWRRNRREQQERMDRTQATHRFPAPSLPPTFTG